MNIQTKGSEQIIGLLDNWYVVIRKRNSEKAKQIKNEIDRKISSVEDENLLFYHALLEFRYQYLTEHLSIGKDSFNKIESFDKPDDEKLSYYYYFFKAMYLTIMGDYNLAKKHYEEAEKKLHKLSDRLESAEFHFKLSTFSCHTQRYVLALKQVSRARELFANNYEGNELNIGYCNNVAGLVCVHLKEYELAEEYLISALDTFSKQKDEHATLYVRHNLGFMYANQNLSELAIRHLSEVSENEPGNYRAILLEACEYEKLGKKDVALSLFEKGLNISNELKIEEYQHHFKILKAINEEVPGEQLEAAILAGNKYFEKENLYEYVDEYTEKLALKFYQEGNDSKASKYFYLSSQVRKENHKKEV
ncbi:tetratricopeptide repeat protein [Bacillus sp. S2(2024)]|uniref:response regulator aspartate phosphatase n=1 Tax=Bacillus sp. S2(2024) TaxID=3162887 RepID=UPI003D1DE153